MNEQKEIQQARIAHVEEFLREAMDEAQQKGITPICRAYHEMHDGKDVGYCIFEAYRAKHGLYPDRKLISREESRAIRDGWDCYVDSISSEYLPHSWQLWHQMGMRLREAYKPITVECLKDKIKEQNASS